MQVEVRHIAARRPAFMFQSPREGPRHCAEIKSACKAGASRRLASRYADSHIGEKAGLVLNSARPYVYVEFDHAGRREPVEDGEPTEGLWLRLVNNSNFTINVETMDTATRSKLVLVPDTITTIPQKIPRSRLVPKRMPVGYASRLGTVQAIASGKDLVFSVPSNHVSQFWSLQVPFEFDVPRTQMHAQSISM